MTTNGKSLMEKLKTLTSNTQSKISKSIKTPTFVASPTITNSSILKSLNSDINDIDIDNVNGKKKGILNILKNILLIIIIIFVILNILAIMGWLPIYLVELVNPFLFFKYNPKAKEVSEKESKKERQAKKKELKELRREKRKNKDEPELVTSIDKESDDEDDSNTALKALETVTKEASRIYPVTYDKADNKTQLSHSRHKSGYCYIGEDRGFRSCIKVNEKEICDSGDIFPTKDICINPKLRN